MEIPENYQFTDDHEWVGPQDSGHRVGITDYAQGELGDVVFVELPSVGQEVKKGETFANIESVKAVSEVYAPVDCKIVAVNEKLSDSPELINESPHEDGWLIQVEVSDSSQLGELMDGASYERHVAEVSK